MKIRFLAVLFAGILSISTSYASGSHGSAHEGSNKHQEKFSVGSGVINSVDKSARTINVSHGPIPSLKWPKMTMDIATSDDIDLSSLKKGQSIKFKIKLDHDNKYRIFKIKNKK